MGKPHLSREARTEIKTKLIAGVIPRKSLAEQYGITHQTVNNIAKELRLEGVAIDVSKHHRKEGTLKNSPEYSVENGLDAQRVTRL